MDAAIQGSQPNHAAYFGLLRAANPRFWLLLPTTSVCRLCGQACSRMLRLVSAFHIPSSFPPSSSSFLPLLPGSLPSCPAPTRVAQLHLQRRQFHNVSLPVITTGPAAGPPPRPSSQTASHPVPCHREPHAPSPSCRHIAPPDQCRPLVGGVQGK